MRGVKLWHQTDGLVILVDSLLVLGQPGVGAAPVVVGAAPPVGRARIGEPQADGLGKVFDSSLVQVQLGVGCAPAVVGQGILGVMVDGLVIVLDNLLGLP